MTLTADAEKAVDIADALSRFRQSVGDQAVEVTRTIAELNHLCSALYETDDLIRASDSRTIANIQDDLHLVHTSISFTLNDVWSILGKVGNGAPNPSATAYQFTWKEICLHCRSHSRQNLSARIQTYHRFLSELCTILKRRPPSLRAIEDMRSDIRTMLDAQDRRLITAPEESPKLALEPIVPLPRTKSYERERGLGSPTESNHSWPREFFPAAPEVPMSPTGTQSTTSWTSSAATDTLHWAKEVFKDFSTISSTAIPVDRSQETSQCFGEPMRYAKDHMEYKMEELFKVTFPRGLCVRLYHRERDHRAKVLCETPEKSGHSWCSVKSLNELVCWRDKTSLYLSSERTSDSRPHAWALMQFSTMERLVLFYCTFLSLRSHDLAQPYTRIRDHELKGEVEYFGGEIHDDNYYHALRVYKDKYSKAIRLQASVLTGDMRHTPVWTAFITHKIYSPTWMRRSDANTVCLQELRRHIFSPRYEPQLASNGEHLLEFTVGDDATGFIQTIKQLADINRRPY